MPRGNFRPENLAFVDKVSVAKSLLERKNAYVIEIFKSTASRNARGGKGVAGRGDFFKKARVAAAKRQSLG